MKPHRQGLMLESLGEMHTAASALELVLDTAAAFEAAGTLPDLSENHLAEIGRIASSIRSACTVTETVIPEHAISKVSQHVASQYGAHLVRNSLNFAVRLHPDELVRQSAQDMLHSYEEAVFNGAMGNSTPEA